MYASRENLYSALFAVPAMLIAASAPSSITLASTPSTSIFGRPVLLVATVTPSTATGSVTFYDGVNVLGTAKLTGGQATLTTILLPAGSRSLRAYYGGDNNDAPSTSATLVQNVNAVPGGQFQAAVNFGAGNGPGSAVVGDFNGDGKADLAVANADGGNVSVLLGNGDGTFQAAVNYGAEVEPPCLCVVGGFNVAVGDFNGDGKADLVVANSLRNNVGVLLGNGDGTFQAAVNYGAGITPESVAVGDFNGDGRADLVVANSMGGNVSVLLGNGDGTFQAAVNYGGGTQPSSVAVGDFNGDGKPDLVVGNHSNVSVLLGNGDGTFQPAVNYGAGTTPASVAVGDFNGDGKADLVVANIDGSNVSVLLGNGDGTFRAPTNYGVGAYPFSVAIGDFSGDGKPDLVVASHGTYTASVLLGNGDGTFQAAVNYGVGSIPESVTVGDFNGDGRADIVVANFQSNNVSVLLNLPPAADLSISITHAGNFAQGQSGATYAITVSDVGDLPTSGTVTVIDSLPPGLSATNISGAGWACVLSALTCTRGDSLAGFSSYPIITVTVKIAVGAPGGVTNTASVSGGGETNTANDTASDFATTFTASQIAQAWTSLKYPAALTAPGAALLMTDGTIMAQQDCSSNWYRLAPDSFGNYANGTWSQAASMQPVYGPSDFSSAVLADGRLVVIGGEYNNPCSAGPVWTNLGAIYDPVANTWSPLSAPSGWNQIGDRANVVLPDGQFLLAGLDLPPASLDPATLRWTNLNGTGKSDPNSEEGWTLLPDGTVLTVDVTNAGNSERYFPSTDTWASAGNTVAPLILGDEIGPQVLRPNGTVFVAGATGHTAIYNVATGTWAAGPDFPTSNGGQLVNNDGPATLLPSGNVLVTAFDSQSYFFFEFDGAHLYPAPVPPPGGCKALLLLPTGQVLCNNEIYTPTGTPNPAWAPTISSAPSVVEPGLNYTITGTQLNGLSQAGAYGDDLQDATNYPLVRIVNAGTGHVFYCRTFNHSTMAVATGTAKVSTHFDCPPSIETGASTLVVVANGIPSAPWSLTVTAAQPGTAPTITSVDGGGLSVPPVASISANGYFSIFGSNFAPAGTSRRLESQDVVNGSLPTSLGSTCVNVGPTRAFPTYVSPIQINAIAPSLPASALVQISVVANCGTANEITSPILTVPVAEASPEFLYWVQNANGQDPVIAVDAVHGDYIGPSGLIPGVTFRPARAGDILTLYAIGFGPTGSGPVPGLIPSSADRVLASSSVRIGGTVGLTSYVGVTPGDAGLYQVNVTIPSGLAPGNYSIVLNVNGASTPTGAFLTIGQ